MSDVRDLISQISSYETAINDLENQINEVSSRIEETEKEINQKEKDIQEKQELLDKRLIAIYESGNTSYLEMLLTSADLSDFISKYYLISEVAQYDTNLITSIKTAKAELENKKSGLENDKKSIETAKAEQVQKRDEIAKLKKDKDKKVANLNAEEKALESELEEFEAEKRKIQAKLEEIARKEEEEARRKAAEAAASGKAPSGSTSVSSNPSSHGYIFPVAGLSKSNINNPTYPSYRGHTGIDVNIGVRGKSVVAVKAGTVEISMSQGSKHYGEYVVVNHHDGTMTLYGHMRSGSRTVKVGDEVKQGQVLRNCWKYWKCFSKTIC